MENVPIAIAIATVSWSVGLFVGMFTAKFVSKKECEKCRTSLWGAIDDIKEALMGGKIKFELRMVKEQPAE